MIGTVQTAVVTLQDMGGRILDRFQKQLPNSYSNIEIDVTKQAKATYILVIELPAGEKITHKF